MGYIQSPDLILERLDLSLKNFKYGVVLHFFFNSFQVFTEPLHFVFLSLLPPLEPPFEYEHRPVHHIVIKLSTLS